MEFCMTKCHVTNYHMTKCLKNKPQQNELFPMRKGPSFPQTHLPILPISYSWEEAGMPHYPVINKCYFNNSTGT